MMSSNTAEYTAVFLVGKILGVHKFHFPFPDWSNLKPLFFYELHTSISIYPNSSSRMKSLDLHFSHNEKEIEHSKFYIILTASAFTLILY